MVNQDVLETNYNVKDTSTSYYLYQKMMTEMSKVADRNGNYPQNDAWTLQLDLEFLHNN